MVQKYQNEISPILNYGISTKTNEKDLKIPNLQPPNWKSPYWMTLYIVFFLWKDTSWITSLHHYIANVEFREEMEYSVMIWFRSALQNSEELQIYSRKSKFS